MTAREVTGWEARIFWLTLGLFCILNLPWRKLIRDYIREHRRDPSC